SHCFSLPIGRWCWRLGTATAPAPAMPWLTSARPAGNRHNRGSRSAPFAMIYEHPASLARQIVFVTPAHLEETGADSRPLPRYTCEVFLGDSLIPFNDTWQPVLVGYLVD